MNAKCNTRERFVSKSKYLLYFDLCIHQLPLQRALASQARLQLKHVLHCSSVCCTHAEPPFLGMLNPFYTSTHRSAARFFSHSNTFFITLKIGNFSTSLKHTISWSDSYPEKNVHENARYSYVHEYIPWNTIGDIARFHSELDLWESINYPRNCPNMTTSQTKTVFLCSQWVLTCSYLLFCLVKPKDFLRLWNVHEGAIGWAWPQKLFTWTDWCPWKTGLKNKSCNVPVSSCSSCRWAARFLLPRWKPSKTPFLSWYAMLARQLPLSAEDKLPLDFCDWLTWCRFHNTST